jgi:RNA polymerase sigma-70 factor (ECF subfamily)
MNQNDIFEQAYIAHGDSIFRYIYFRIFDRETARDLTQETFYKVWDYLAKGKEVENMKAFLYRTAHNITVNAIRAKRPISSLESIQEAMGFDAPDKQEQQFTEDAREVHEIIESFSILKEADADVMKMRYVDGLSIQEISSITEVSENAISVKIHRLLEKLREYHNQHET